jgi:hypothetical protein
MEHGETSNDELARMIKEGFDDNAARLGRLEADMKDVKHAVEGVVQHYEFDELERRVDVLEKKVRPATN